MNIHLLNLLQIGTPWSDGTEGVTQCPIIPGETFKYQFKVDRVSVGVLKHLCMRFPLFPSSSVLVNALKSSEEDYIFLLARIASSKCPIMQNFALCTAWDLFIPRALWNAKRSRAIWINPSITSWWKVRTFCLWLWSQHHPYRLVPPKYLRTSHWIVLHSFCLGWGASGIII